MNLPNRQALLVPSRQATSLILIVAGSLILIAMVIVSMGHAINSDWSSIRLAPIFAVSKGLPLYSTSALSPWVAIGYGPAYPLAYLPCLLLRNTISAICMATVLAHAWIMIPVSCFVLRELKAESSGGVYTRTMSWMGALTGVLLIPSSESLIYVSESVHVDAPALGSLLLALFFSSRREPEQAYLTRDAAVSGIFLAFAICCKITILPSAILVAAFHYLGGGRKKAFVFLSSLLIAVFITYGIAIVSCGLEAVALQFKILGKFPWIGSGVNALSAPRSFSVPEKLTLLATEAGRTLFSLGGIAAIALLLMCQPSASTAAIPLRRRISFGHDPAAQLLAISFLLLLPALASQAKYGGDVNSYALFLLPFVLCLILLSERLCLRLGTAYVVSSVNTFLMVVIVLQGLRIAHSALKVSLNPLLRESSAIVRNDGKRVWFPGDPLSHLIHEGRMTGSLDAIYSYSVGGFPVSADALIRGLPPECNEVAISKVMEPWGGAELRRLLPPIKVPDDVIISDERFSSWRFR